MTKLFKNISVIIIPVVIAILAVGCSSGKEKLNTKISVLEKELYNDSTFVPDNKKAKDVISLYNEFADKYPDDTLSPSYIFKAGDISSKINETAQAVAIFGKMEKKYPDHRNTPYAIFLQGFIYENQVGDPASAKPYYEKFLQKYPDHPIAGDVSRSIENLGKTPEELIKEFELKNNTDSLATKDSSVVI